MDYRCSSSVAGLVVLIGGSCAFLAPAIHAGDRIDFSDPLIPLAIPRSDVEIKEPQKPISSISAAEGPNFDADFVPPQEFTVTKPRSRDKDPWNENPLQDNSDPRSTDDLFNARQQPNLLTNSALFKLQHSSDASDSDRMLLRKTDSKFGADQDASRMGARMGWDKDHGRDGDLFGQDRTARKNESSLLKVFSLDPASSDRFSAWQPRSFTGEASSMTGVFSGESKTKWGQPAETARALTLPPGYGSYDPADNGHGGDQAASNPGYQRAWEPAETRVAPSMHAANPAQFNASHVAAPKRPVNLPLPKRPSDPNPY